MKLAILDKDGTLVLPKSGNTFVQNPTDQILMFGAIEGCQRLIDAGYVLAIASNQGGVASNHKTLDVSDCLIPPTNNPNTQPPALVI